MTKKDYIRIAAALADYRNGTTIGWECAETDRQREVVDSIAPWLARTLADDNPRFDRDRFLLACKGKD